MPGYMPHDVQDFADAADGDAMAAAICALHCTPREEPRSLTFRLSAVAERLAGRDLDVVEQSYLRAAMRAAEAAVAELEDLA